MVLVEITIGLVLVYLLVSLICSAVSELIAAVLRLRARNLVAGVRTMLTGTSTGGDANDWAGKVLTHPLVSGLYDGERPWFANARWRWLYMIFRPGVGPSYIPSQTFAVALLNRVLEDAGGAPAAAAGGLHHVPSIAEIRAAVQKIPETHLRGALLALVNEAANDVNRLVTDVTKVQDQIEIWFNDSMDRVGGWYKRNVQFLLFFIAVAVCGMMNVDTFSIAEALQRDRDLREAVVKLAERRAATPLPAPTTAPATPLTPQEAQDNLVRSVNDLEALGLPIGWKERREGLSAQAQLDPRLPPEGWGWPKKVLGILLTAFAASLGAPFWFDLLNKFISIRAAGKAPEETPKAPKEEPKPRAPEETPPLTPARGAAAGRGAAGGSGGAGTTGVRRPAAALRHWT